MSTEAVETESKAGRVLVLDSQHTLVEVGLEDLEALWMPTGGGSACWLLFRSGPVARSPEGHGDGRPPQLWVEFGGGRIDGDLRELAGWGELGSAAVALFEVPTQFAASRPAEVAVPAVCGLRIGDREIVAHLPAEWVERLRSQPPDLR